MHPAKSVIYFTTASGAGYGLIFMLAVLRPFQLVPSGQGFGFAVFAVALALIVSGLLSSTLHLGHPERAWRALSQWRSSWLSREGLAAILAFAPIGLYAFWWVILDETGGLAVLFGLAAAALCLVTVYCTAMIYASLRTIPAWHNPWTVVGYLGLAAMTGALLLNGLVGLWDPPAASPVTAVALVATAIGLAVKLVYWSTPTTARGASTAETATGLGHIGTVRLLESPHTSDNFLMKEMGFRIARKHAATLRAISVIAGFAVPAVLLAIALFVGGGAGAALSAVAILPAAIGIAIERWLFFAEAKHAVTLYYGADAI